MAPAARGSRGSSGPAPPACALPAALRAPEPGGGGGARAGTGGRGLGMPAQNGGRGLGGSRWLLPLCSAVRLLFASLRTSGPSGGDWGTLGFGGFLLFGIFFRCLFTCFCWFLFPPLGARMVLRSWSVQVVLSSSRSVLESEPCLIDQGCRGWASSSENSWANSRALGCREQGWQGRKWLLPASSLSYLSTSRLPVGQRPAQLPLSCHGWNTSLTLFWGCLQRGRGFWFSIN